MSNRKTRARAVIDNHIHVWSSTAAFAPLAEILKVEREPLIDLLAAFTSQGMGPDAVRLFLLSYVLERLACSLDFTHFTLFREAETVQVVLEDAFGMIPGEESDEIIIPHQDQALKIMVRCLFGKKSKDCDSKDMICFLRLFSRMKPDLIPDHDRIMRFKSMVWFIYLAIEVIKVERNICLSGLEIFRNKFRELLDQSLEQSIINEQSRQPGFESGKWENTLFGWLQGEDRKEFVEKLKRQFNLENRVEHANRFLLARHRKCILEQVLHLFC